jgi:hypothetical protein
MRFGVRQVGDGQGVNPMQRWMGRLRLAAYGGLTLGVLQAIQDIDFNQLWLLFWSTVLNWLVVFLTGADPDLLLQGGAGSPFGSFFV